MKEFTKYVQLLYVFSFSCFFVQYVAFLKSDLPHRHRDSCLLGHNLLIRNLFLFESNTRTVKSSRLNKDAYKEI